MEKGKRKGKPTESLYNLHFKSHTFNNIKTNNSCQAEENFYQTAPV